MSNRVPHRSRTRIAAVRLAVTLTFAGCMPVRDIKLGADERVVGIEDGGVPESTPPVAADAALPSVQQDASKPVDAAQPVDAATPPELDGAQRVDGRMTEDSSASNDVASTTDAAAANVESGVADAGHSDEGDDRTGH